jgi:hypothetical protein
VSLREDQSKFAKCVGKLIGFAYESGYELTFGDAWAHDNHRRDSFHYKRLAIDLNLFKDGQYLVRTEDHRVLGEYWESLDPKCSWGGRWMDGNHYSYGEGRSTDVRVV